MQSLDRITMDTAKMNGKPCIRGMRLTVGRVLKAMATYPDRGELFKEYPELEEEDIRLALLYAARIVGLRSGRARKRETASRRKMENSK